MSLELPLLEEWQGPLSFLDDDARARFDDADFYERLRDAIAARFASA